VTPAAAQSARPADAPPACLERAAGLVGPALDRAVARLTPALQEPVRHHLAGGGKRVRAALALVSAVAAGSDEGTGLPGAVAVELVHNYSLIHDDLMDGDTERRHRPTVWARYGAGTAVIAGDALAALAVEVLLDEPSAPRVAAAAALTRANQEMIAGQAADMAFEGRPEVGVDECRRMELAKTGALLGCAASIGAILAGADPATVGALDEFGRQLGAAFQAVDDLLGVWGDPERTGKPVGNDLVQRKQSLPVVLARAAAGSRRTELDAALAAEMTPGALAAATGLLEALGARQATQEQADRHFATALAALDRVALVPDAHQELVAVARFVTERDR
jgi:geranylgeranyl diphosphate synthase type I